MSDGETAEISQRVTVVLPTYNEAENLPLIVGELLSQPVKGLGILVVDDNSPDGTGELAETLADRSPGQVEVLHRPAKLGLGTAYVLGFRYALEGGAQYVVQIDADFSHSPSDLPRLLEKMDDYDLVLGSRYVTGGRLDENWTLERRLLSRWANFYARLITGLQVKDVTTGFRCLKREVLQDLDLDIFRSEGYAFLIEMLVVCQRKGYRLGEVPIIFKERNSGRTKMSWSVILEAAWRVWQLRFVYR